MGRQNLARLFAVAGFVLATTAGGVLLPGSAPVRAQSIVIAAAPEQAPAASSIDPPSAASWADAARNAQHEQATPATAPEPPTSSTPAPAALPGELPAMSLVTDDGLPVIAPSPVTHLTIPTIGVDADVLPVDNHPTGEVNAWGGQIFTPIEFPVDEYARQWIRRGDPNTVPAADAAGDVQAFDRTFLYGHASDIGHHLIFQDLSGIALGARVHVDTALGHFTYTVTQVLTSQKTDLDNFAELYDYPTDGTKQLALVACLPDTTNNVVVLAALTDARVA